ncbi:MAG: hypothetical protein COB66_08565 [Coxiella sp. (in: Bacteria)]|nr:MAG: hypothetical protein COB66_08565 [Coxiella sp. (in: g-proteobacteria)]
MQSNAFGYIVGVLVLASSTGAISAQCTRAAFTSNTPSPVNQWKIIPIVRAETEHDGGMLVKRSSDWLTITTPNTNADNKDTTISRQHDSTTTNCRNVRR